MTDAVLADAQFSVARVLKPDPSFVSVYQGKNADVPIAFPGNLEKLAGQPGYSTSLLAAYPVPLGSKILLWVPSIKREDGSTPDYSYSFLFRLRNLQDFRESRKAYHFPKQSPGTNSQFVIPAAKRVIYYEQASVEPGGTNTSSVLPLRNQTRASFESLTFETTLEKGPLTPSGTLGDVQQGIGQPNTDATFNPIQLDCEGDEMMILVTKSRRRGTSVTDKWDFESATEDQKFAEVFGPTYSDLGIYLFSGSNP